MHTIKATVTREMIEDLTKQHGFDTVQAIEKEIVAELAKVERITKLEKLISNEKNKKSR